MHPTTLHRVLSQVLCLLSLLIVCVSCTHHERTELFEAARLGRTEEVQRLLMAGADVNRAAPYGGTPLATAAYNGHTACVNALLRAKGIDVNKADKNGETPLNLAVFQGHTDCMTALIRAGADVNKGEKNGITPLIQAAFRGRADDMLALLKAGANANQTAKVGMTPLHVAAQQGHASCVKRLLRVPGIELNTENKEGKTPLDVAKNTEIKQLLLHAGGRPGKGKTPRAYQTLHPDDYYEDYAGYDY